MDTLTEWTARSAGGRITINGFDTNTMQPRKIVGVDKIEKTDPRGRPIATDKEGNRFELL